MAADPMCKSCSKSDSRHGTPLHVVSIIDPHACEQGKRPCPCTCHTIWAQFMAERQAREALKR